MSGTKIAIKSLSQSDLSFFKAHQQRSNQKALQLDSEVFVECFYPGLRGSLEQRVLLLTLMGPGGRGPHPLTRLALRLPGAEDWLIKGELVRDPEEEPGRYGELREGDFVIMAFEGHAQPESVMLVLVSATEDSVLHETLAGRLEFTGKHGMRKVAQAVIAQLRADTLDAYPDGEHPLDTLISPDTVEDALFGTGAPAPTDARRSGRQAPLSPEALRRQLLAAEEIGQQGEELFGAWLTATGHEEGDFTWISETHARSAYDLEVHAARWLDGTPKVFVDVKTTRGPFERQIHMSIAELRFAVETEGYRIARLYKLDAETPKLRMLTGVQAVAARILEQLEALPEGVMVDSLQLEPGLFDAELSTELS
ncbi:hypothetical protein ACN28I_23435 [Archangium gephyra]|uniref:hypothetical protein n=1 Tax=Archangium gephyra TaxID=48 RepID=UPI003B795C25